MAVVSIAWRTAAGGATALPANGAHVRPDCAGCAAISFELERRMHEEWSHLKMTVRDRKRTLAAHMLREQECDEAIATMLAEICESVQKYAVGTSASGGRYYQRVAMDRQESGRPDRDIVVTGVIVIGPSGTGLRPYCEALLAEHEVELAQLMADGTDDLQTDMCVTLTSECTAQAVSELPAEARPLQRRLQEEVAAADAAH